jgi:aspartate/methionine/tyrosine aminotransferase
VPQPSISDIILTEGASQGVHLIFSTIILDKNDSIMIPIPQYPLYTASISLYGGSACPYYLD